MAFNRRRNFTYSAPKVEVVKIDPPKPPVIDTVFEKPKKNGGFLGLGDIGGIKDIFKNITFDAEDIMLIALILLFMNIDDEDYSMMIPALIYILLG